VYCSNGVAVNRHESTVRSKCVCVCGPAFLCIMHNLCMPAVHLLGSLPPNKCELRF
jgi:hypothetical protein